MTQKTVIKTDSVKKLWLILTFLLFPCLLVLNIKDIGMRNEDPHHYKRNIYHKTRKEKEYDQYHSQFFLHYLF